MFVSDDLEVTKFFQISFLWLHPCCLVLWLHSLHTHNLLCSLSSLLLLSYAVLQSIMPCSIWHPCTAFSFVLPCMKATIFRATDTLVDLARFWRLLASSMWHLAVSSVHINIWKECAACFIIVGGECRYLPDNSLLHCRALWFLWILLWNSQVFFPMFVLWTFALRTCCFLVTVFDISFPFALVHTFKYEPWWG